MPTDPRRWIVILEDKNSGIKLGKRFWTRWRARAHLHHVANNPDISYHFMTRLVDLRKADAH